LMREVNASKYNLYFAVRSIVSASIGFFTFSFIALILRSLTGLQAIILNLVCFAYPVVLTKVLHERIQRLVERALSYLEKNRRIGRLVTKVIS